MKKKSLKKRQMELTSIQCIERTYDLNGRCIFEKIELYSPNKKEDDEKVVGFRNNHKKK
jgi:hypothetical protein